MMEMLFLTRGFVCYFLHYVSFPVMLTFLLDFVFISHLGTNSMSLFGKIKFSAHSFFVYQLITFFDKLL